MLKVGECLKVETKTKDDTFGTCYYEVLDVGLGAPEKERKDQSDGVRCYMLGGTGASANEGRVVIDSQHRIGIDIRDGRTKVISKKQAVKELSKVMHQKANVKSRGNLPQDIDANPRRPDSGCMEI